MLPLQNARSKSRKKGSDVTNGLSKEKIVSKALELIDENGIENFSMRNIAKALGVYPTAIYWHVPSRNALLGEVVASVLRDLAPEYEEKDWQGWLCCLFRRYRDRIRDHPNVAPLIGVQLASNTMIDFEMIERILRVLKQAGFSDENIPAAYNTVIGTMVGYTTQEYAMVPPDDREQWQEDMREAVADMDGDKYPTTYRHLDAMRNKAFIMRWENGVDAPLDEGFEMFVESVIVGLQHIAARDQKRS